MLIFRLLSHRAAKTKKERELERENAFALRSPARALKIKTILLINYNFDHVLPSGNKTPLPVHLPSKFFGPPFLEKSIKISSFPLNSPSSSHFFVFSPAHPGVPSSPKTLADVFDRTSIPLKHPGWFGSEYLPLKTEEEDSVVIVAPDDKTSAFIANAAVFVVVVVVISKRTVAAAFAATFDDDDEKLLEQNTEPFFFFDFFESRVAEAPLLLAGEAGKKRWTTTTDDDEKFVAPIIFLLFPSSSLSLRVPKSELLFPVFPKKKIKNSLEKILI